jgi:DNA repair exonuclease SbcCD ATPase subunit
LPELQRELKQVNSRLAGARNDLSEASEKLQAFVKEGPGRVDSTLAKQRAAEMRYVEAQATLSEAKHPAEFKAKSVHLTEALGESRAHERELRAVPSQLAALRTAEASAQHSLEQLTASARDLQQAIKQAHRADMQASAPRTTQEP